MGQVLIFGRGVSVLSMQIINLNPMCECNPAPSHPAAPRVVSRAHLRDTLICAAPQRLRGRVGRAQVVVRVAQAHPHHADYQERRSFRSCGSSVARVLICLWVPRPRECADVRRPVLGRGERALRVCVGGLGSLKPIRIRVASQNRV